MNNSEFQLVKLHGGYFVQEKSASISKTEIEQELIRIIQGSGGHVDNLSICLLYTSICPPHNSHG